MEGAVQYTDCKADWDNVISDFVLCKKKIDLIPYKWTFVTSFIKWLCPFYRRNFGSVQYFSVIEEIKFQSVSSAKNTFCSSHKSWLTELPNFGGLH